MRYPTGSGIGTQAAKTGLRGERGRIMTEAARESNRKRLEIFRALYGVREKLPAL
jgi:hypothetical protein